MSQAASCTLDKVLDRFNPKLTLPGLIIKGKNHIWCNPDKTELDGDVLIGTPKKNKHVNTTPLNTSIFIHIGNSTISRGLLNLNKIQPPRIENIVKYMGPKFNRLNPIASLLLASRSDEFLNRSVKIRIEYPTELKVAISVKNIIKIELSAIKYCSRIESFE